MARTGAVIVRPRVPYFNWANNIDRGFSADPGDRRGFSGLYLLPPFEDVGAEERILRQHFARIFENELFAWYEDRTIWPKRRTYATFLEWFEVEFLDLVHDATDLDLEAEPA